MDTVTFEELGGAATRDAVLTAGVRRDDHSVFGTQDSPYVGGRVDLWKATLRTSYGGGFRAPKLAATLAAAREVASLFKVLATLRTDVPVGTVDEMCAELEARRERWQMSSVVVPEEFTDVFAPVVARLAGT